MVGVYCYSKEDKPIYVGCSIDLRRRKSQHKSNGRFLDCEYKVLEETSVEEMYERERYWINKLNTFNEGENKVIHNNMDIPEIRDKNSKRMRKDNPMKPGMTNRGSFIKGNKPIITEERNKKISQSKVGNKNPNYGNSNSWNHVNKVLIECQVCGKIMTKGNFIRWRHGRDCKNGFH